MRNLLILLQIITATLLFSQNYSIEDLCGKQIIAAMNLGNKRIGSFVSEVLVMGVDDNNSNVVLLEPSTKIENGAKVN